MSLKMIPVTEYYEPGKPFEDKREGEYRIPDRDKFSSGKLTLPNGVTVKFNRFVNRVGYALDSHSYTKEQWDEEGLNLVCALTSLDKETVQKVIKVLNLHSAYKGMRAKIYQRLVGDKIKDTHRSMWFKDFEAFGEIGIGQGQIVGRCRKWTGEYYQGRDYGNAYVGDWGYDPPCLVGVNQNLYLVKNCDNGSVYMVHPADIITE